MMGKRWLAGLLFGVLLVAAAGCGAPAGTGDDTGDGAAQEDAERAAAEEPARVLAADDLSNLQLAAPDVPVYDAHTLAERQAQGLAVTLPELVPYREGKVAYLTFDDGPDDENTPAVLDVLKEAGVKATFYVTGVQAKAHPEVLRRIYDEGHAIGNHSYDHRYEKLYPSVDGFFREMAQTDEILYGILGVRPLILRAPGGRIGHFTAAYAPALKAHGYVEHD